MKAIKVENLPVAALSCFGVFSQLIMMALKKNIICVVVLCTFVFESNSQMDGGMGGGGMQVFRADSSLMPFL
jgi:hypothetical protein